MRNLFSAGCHSRTLDPDLRRGSKAMREIPSLHSMLKSMAPARLDLES
jgi:hypothetical protein